MSKILRFLTCLFCIVFIGDAVFAAGYECPTHRQYTTCNKGYYLAYSYTGTSYDSIKHCSTPRAGNACRPCTDYDTHYNKPKGYYYCEGKTAAPVLNKFTITYDLNGGSGTTPDNESCTKGQTCTLNDGATTSFYRAGYVFKGWSKSKSATTGSTSLTFTANTTVYAVWEPCGVGKYKEGSENADAECSACPEPLDGFVFDTGVIIATLPEECSIYAYDLHPLNEWCASTPDDTSKQLLYALWGSDDTWHVFTNALAISVVPGAYANPPGGSLPPQPGVEIESFDDLCLPCGIGTYSEGGDVTSCSACPQPTDGFEYVPTTGNTSLTACKQGLKNPADINEFCEAASGTAEAFKIQCVAASDDTWGNCIRTGFPFDAKPGCYVGITSQSQPMPIEDVVENICKQCKDGTWSYGEDVTSCSACPALRPADEQAGWKISSGGDGATRVQDCYAYLESYPTNCASGSFKRMYRGDAAAGYYESQWFEWEPLTAKPGYMVQFEDGQTTAPACVECSKGTYSPGGDVHLCSECPDLPTGFAYASITGLKKKTQCLAAAANVGLLNENCRDEITSAPVRLVVGAEDDTDWTLYYTVPTTTSMIRANPGAYVNPEILTDGTWQPYSNFNADELCKLCQAGTYNGDMSQTVTSCTACPTGYDDNPETGLTSPDMCQINCPGGYYLAAANDATCSEVSPGYWAAEKIVNYGDTSTRTECASGLTTIGYGAGADEAADCGRVLHFGNDTLYLRSVKKTDHALHVGINGTVFYGNMGTDLSKSSLRIKLGDTTYSVYDDSMQ